MQHIVRNPYYQIALNPFKNRVYLTITGFWETTRSVPNYLSDWQRTLQLVKPGFTVLSDAVSMKTHPLEVRLLHESVQLLLIKAGLQQVAKVCPLDDIADLQSDTMIRNTNLPMRKFNNYQEAEAWLDQLQVPYPMPVEQEHPSATIL